MPTPELIRHGATGGFYSGLVVDFDAVSITVARDSDKTEVKIPRRLIGWAK